MQKINYKYWLSHAAGVILIIGAIATQAGDQGLLDKENKNYKWLLLGCGAVNLFLTGASKTKPWLPEDVNHDGVVDEKDAQQ